MDPSLAVGALTMDRPRGNRFSSAGFIERPIFPAQRFTLRTIFEFCISDAKPTGEVVKRGVGITCSRRFPSEHAVMEENSAVGHAVTTRVVRWLSMGGVPDNVSEPS